MEGFLIEEWAVMQESRVQAVASDVLRSARARATASLCLAERGGSHCLTGGRELVRREGIPGTSARHLPITYVGM